MECARCLVVYWIFIFVIKFYYCEGTPTNSSCVFPYFLWQDADNSEEKVWLTELLFISNSKTWENRLKVTVSSQVYTTSTEVPWLCEEDDTPYQLNAGRLKRRPCVKSAVKSETRCLSIEAGNKYRVLVTNLSNGKQKYICMEFIRRNENAVEVIESRAYDTDEVSLCSKDQMTHNEWPWIAQELRHLEPCPMVGGYDFNAYINDRPKKLCPRVWRPSRLESECLLGEGFQVSFPEKTCSFFQDRQKEVRLVCVAWWQEGNRIHVLAAEKGYGPQYSMILPRKHLDTHTEETSYFYFSPIFPRTKNHIPPTNIMHVEMKIHRSATESCYDESAECVEFARQGKCTNDGFYYYGNYCKKSCGLCDFVPNAVPECDFPVNYQGDWILFETDQKESVSILGGRITFSKMGNFICKSKHWKKPYYKLLSIYDNGCRPRFTCIQLEYNDDSGFLRLNLSPSNMVDYSFNLCNFEDESLKILFPLPQISLFSCGLGALVELQALMTGVDSCRGTLADWNPFTCNVVPTLTLSLRACKQGGMQIFREFTCEAHINLNNDHKILLTRELTVDSLDHPQYQCWLIKMYPRSNNSHASVWRHVSLLKRAQCGGDGDLDPEIYKPTEAIFQIYPDTAAQHCIEEDHRPNNDQQGDPTLEYTVNSRHRYNNNNNNRLGSKHPRTVPHQQIYYDTFANSNIAHSTARADSILITVLPVMLMFIVNNCVWW